MKTLEKLVKDMITQLDYPYFKSHYKMIEEDLRNQTKLHVDPQAIKQIKFAGNLGDNAIKFEEVKETILDFSQGTVTVTKYNGLNIKLSNLQLKKLKPPTKILLK